MGKMRHKISAAQAVAEVSKEITEFLTFYTQQPHAQQELAWDHATLLAANIATVIIEKLAPELNASAIFETFTLALAGAKMELTVEELSAEIRKKGQDKSD